MGVARVKPSLSGCLQVHKSTGSYPTSQRSSPNSRGGGTRCSPRTRWTASTRPGLLRALGMRVNPGESKKGSITFYDYSRPYPTSHSPAVAGIGRKVSVTYLEKKKTNETMFAIPWSYDWLVGLIYPHFKLASNARIIYQFLYRCNFDVLNCTKSIKLISERLCRRYVMFTFLFATMKPVMVYQPEECRNFVFYLSRPMESYYPD